MDGDRVLCISRVKASCLRTCAKIFFLFYLHIGLLQPRDRVGDTGSSLICRPLKVSTFIGAQSQEGNKSNMHSKQFECQSILHEPTPRCFIN
jgi:hypothetical protein